MLFKRKRQLKKSIEKEQAGIFNRYVREQQNWISHLINTQNFIINELTNTEFKSIAVLGSGWLLDILMEFLIQKFEKIYLIDIAHPAQIKKKFSSFSQILFIEFDVSQNFEQLAENKEIQTEVTWPFKVDIVISVNLLSQLAELPNDYFNSVLSREVMVKIQQEHLNLLTKYRKYLLISDEEEIRYSKTEVNTQKLVYCPLPVADKKQEWIWKFENSENYIKEYNKIDKMVWALSGGIE